MSLGELSPLERLLRRQWAITAAGLAMLCALSWIYVVAGAGLGMSAWDMTTLSLFPHKAPTPMPGMTSPAWTPQLWALTIAMWWTMMVAMMTPSAAPAIQLYGRVHRHATAQGRAVGLAPSGAFAAGYFLAWLAFSLAAAGLYWALDQAGLMSAGLMGSKSRWLSGGALLAAGLYQLSPMHNVCLSHCRSPASFLSRHWRPGVLGATRLGLLHGGYCVGCCWLLMGLLFVGGVMNLAWIAGLALLVMAEKLVRGGPWIGRAGGVVLIAWGLATLVV